MTFPDNDNPVSSAATAAAQEADSPNTPAEKAAAEVPSPGSDAPVPVEPVKAEVKAEEWVQEHLVVAVAAAGRSAQRPDVVDHRAELPWRFVLLQQCQRDAAAPLVDPEP